MMTQTGQVNSFKELGEHFLEFVQQSNDTTDPWEVIDDRLDSFYGATIRFPLTSNETIKNKLPIISCDSDEICCVFPDDFWYTGLINAVRSDISGISDLSVLSSDGWTNKSSKLWIRKFFEQVYGKTDVSSETMVDSSYMKDADTVDASVYSIDNFTTNDELRFQFYSKVDPLYSAFLQYADSDFSAFVDKKHVIIFCPVVTFFYYFDCENALFTKLAQYLDALRQKCSQKLSQLNPDINMDSLHVDVIFIYMPNYIVDMDVKDNKLYLSDDSSQAIYNYTFYMQSYFADNFYFINALDILHNNSMNRIISAIDSCVKPLLVKDFGQNSRYLYKDFSNYENYMGGNIYKNNICHYSNSNFSNCVNVADIWTIWSGDLNGLGAPDFNHDTISNINNSDSKFKIKNKFGNSAYISLQYNKITPTTYNDWLTNTKDHYMSETFNSNRRRPVWYSDSLVYERTTISNQRQNDIANIFKNTGEVLFISPHIKYDKNLWMAEQGGIACDHETRNQSIEDNCLRAHLLRYPVSGGTPQLTFQKLPPFPSLGCPMFTIDDKQLSQSVEIGEMPIKYYFVRDNNSASIVIYSRLTGANAGSYAVQHMSFGALNCFSISEQFLYPLYVAGGNGALDKEHWVFYYPNGGTPQHDVGNIYNLDMGSISMSNSNIALSAKFNGANITNFRVLCPDGHWDNIFNAVQTCRLVVDPDECYPNAWTTRYYLYNKPEVGGSELGDNRYGGTVLEYGYNNIKKIDTHLINHDYLGNPSTRMYIEDITASSPLTPIVPTFSSHKNVSPEIWSRHRYGSIGMIPHCYTSWSRYLKFGELEINGKKFLAIPCAYEDRLWWPETRTSVNLADLDNQMNMMRNINNKLSNYVIYDYVLLELEE